MTTDILSNGNKWAGQAPDDLATLLDVLGRHPLEGCFAPFIRADPASPGRVSFFGNFTNVSHVFRVVTDDPEVIATLAAAIVLNVLRADYHRIPAAGTGT